MTDRRYLVKDAERVVSELQEIRNENLYVVDDEAFIQAPRMLELADAIEQAGLRHRYHMYVRTDTTVRRPDVIARWAGIGLDSVLIGAESMTDDELTGYAKGTCAAQTRQAIDLFHSLGVKVRANFIVQPGWDEADFDRLEHTVAELGVDMPSFSVLTPLPGTDLFDSVRNQLISDEPELFDCYHTLFPTRLPAERFYQRVSELLVGASHRTGQEGPGVFYFATDDAFGAMVSKVRQGHLLDTGLAAMR
jgi:methyltransferase